MCAFDYENKLAIIVNKHKYLIIFLKNESNFLRLILLSFNLKILKKYWNEIHMKIVH